MRELYRIKICDSDGIVYEMHLVLYQPNVMDIIKVFINTIPNVDLTTIDIRKMLENE